MGMVQVQLYPMHDYSFIPILISTYVLFVYPNDHNYICYFTFFSDKTFHLTNLNVHEPTHWKIYAN